MQHRHLCFGLLASALLTACQSAPHPNQVTEASSKAERELDSVIVTGSVMQEATRDTRQRALRREAAAKSMPAPPAAPMSISEARPSDAYAYAPAATAGYLSAAPLKQLAYPQQVPANSENYTRHKDNPVHRAVEQPISTFSIDVDTGSYSNVRRMLRDGIRPPADAVRAEEFINYFDYQHPAPTSQQTPFRVSTELSPAPWNAQRQLLMIGIKGYDVPKANLPPSNLVFLIDTSGSMEDADKLPLLKQAFSLLVPQLRKQDRVSIVVYAGSAGLVLPPTPGDRHEEILAALEQLEAGGSTNGGEGIQLAYAMARQAYLKQGNNRVILATDGDFNVGTVAQGSLETLVADQRKSGIALTTLGFGQGNYNDAMAEHLADAGDGNHAYIDTLQEARKVLVDEMQSTLLTIARDVKIQIEFNPAVVAEYRLIGYENRLLNEEDFANDKVDAGDIGAGHEVTALYEITPVGSTANRLPALRYGDSKPLPANSNELAHLRLRYKLPGQDNSRLIESPIAKSSLTRQPSNRFQFATAVAAYADLLRGGSHIDGWSWPQVQQLAKRSQGDDRFGLRHELVQLIGQAQQRVAQENSNPAIAQED